MWDYENGERKKPKIRLNGSSKLTQEELEEANDKVYQLPFIQ